MEEATSAQIRCTYFLLSIACGYVLIIMLSSSFLNGSAYLGKLCIGVY